MKSFKALGKENEVTNEWKTGEFIMTSKCISVQGKQLTMRFRRIKPDTEKKKHPTLISESIGSQFKFKLHIFVNDWMFQRPF